MAKLPDNLGDHNIYIGYEDEDYDLLYKKIMVGFKIFESILFFILTGAGVIIAGSLLAYFNGGF